MKNRPSTKIDQGLDGDGGVALMHERALAAVSQGVLICDENRLILYANAGFENITGYAPAEVLGQQCSRLQGADTDPATLAELRAAVHAGRPFEGEILNYRKDGRPFWNELSITPVHDDEGQLIRFIGIQRDVTVRKEAEEALRQSEERFASAFDNAAIGKALVGLDGRWLKVNRAGCEFFGYTEAELMALTFQDVTHPDDLEADLKQVRSLLAGEISSYQMEKRYVHRRGHFINGLLSVSLVRDRGAPLYFISQIQDITERKRAEEQIAANEALLREFIQHAPAAIAMLDTDMCYIQASERWMLDYNLADEDIIGRSHYEVFPDAPARWKAIHQRVLAGVIERCDEDSFARADGRTDWLQWEVRPWHKSGGEIGGVIMFTQVITARRHAEEALRVSEERFRQSSAQLKKVLDSSLDAICAFDANGCFRQVSAACERIWGYRPEELLGTPYLDKVLPEDQPRTLESAAEIMAGKTTSSFENRYVRKDGSVAHIMWSAWWSEADQSMFCVARDNTASWRLQRALEMLSGCNEALIRIEDEIKLLEAICGIAVKIGGYRMAWVGFARDDEARSIQPITHAGAEEGYLSEIEVTWAAEKPSGQGPAGRTIRSGDVVVCEDTATDLTFASWRESATRRGYRGAICLPLRVADRTVGVLVLYSSEPRAVAAGEVELLQEMAADLAFGIGNIRSRQEARRMQEAVLKIAQGVSFGGGSEFFDLLTGSLVEALGADCGMVGRLVEADEPSVESVSLVIDHRKVSNVTYALAGTPCEQALTEDICVIERGVQRQYPSDKMLEDLGIEAYAGLPLRTSRGTVLGLLAVMFHSPIEHSEMVMSTLRIFAARAASELERQQTDAQVREQAALLDKARDAIVVRDLEQRITYWNKSAERLYGWSAEEVRGRVVTDFVYHNVSEFQQLQNEFMRSGEWAGELRQVTRDGRDVIVDSRWTLVRDAAGQPVSTLVINTDVTERKKAQETLLLTAKRMELAAKASKVGIWDWDVITGSIHWDEKMCALYGDNVEQGSFELWRQLLHPDDYERANAEVAQALLPDGPPFDTAFRIRVPPSGFIRHIRAQAIVFRDDSGQPLRMIGTNWDVTEQVEREEILRQKLEDERTLRLQATAGEKAKSEFLAVMSHEIRTPMNGVLGFAEMLAQSPTLTAENRDLCQTIVSSGEALLRILDDILDFSRIEARRLSIEEEVFSPKELVHGIQALFARQIREKGLEFIVSMAEDVPEGLRGDAGRVRQVLVNLIGNALKFTERGSIRVGVHPLIAEGAHWLEFVVQDTGAGVAPDRAEAIFEAFTQQDSSISRRHGGTGLGLTISRRLAELMGGDLQMCSAPGEGATFTLRIPHVQAGPSENAVSPGPRLVSQMDADFAIRHPQRILVVEDDKVNLKLILSVLRKLGYEPLEAGNGVEAVAVYEHESPDCILMDVQMPVMDGLEATRNIRAIERARPLRPAYISALTANILPEDQQRCFDAGMNGYLNKPVKSQVIANVLVDAWEFRQRRSGSID